ncbi:MAG TPA: hypothetical protein VGZ27_20380 [Vicinamibacterales bacterium]|jgi:hypothetical protein|nr:hypothetical protein [Vicinamibacterales bacterium]
MTTFPVRDPTSGFIIYNTFIKNWSPIEETQWRVGLVCANAPKSPTATITSPSADVVTTLGAVVSFAGTGTANAPDATIVSYLWTFPGGTPSASLDANPGNVTFGAGIWTVIFEVIDSNGETAGAKRQVVVLP